MSVKYEDPAYANDRLAGSLVRYRNRPVFVEYIEDGIARISGTTSRNKKWINVPYEELDLTPVPLGNVNWDGGVVFTRRMPKRRDWRQGLRSNNWNCSIISGDIHYYPNFTDREVAKTILNKFPSVEECMNCIECGEVLGMAFSRFFSVSHKEKEGFCVYYRDKHIGYTRPDRMGVVFELKDEYKYLNEFLREEMKIV